MEGFAGKVCVVTGAGSGIGQALAIELARSGAKLAISDVNLAGLAATEERLKAIGSPARADRLDVSDRAAVLAYADEVRDHYGSVHQIYNNAGIAHTGDIEICEFKEIERVVDVDFWGVVNGTKAFLPHLIESGDGHVVDVSSLFGIFSVPGQSAYNAAKFAVRGITETLRLEMEAAGHPVKALSVHPGGIKTNIARNARVHNDLLGRAQDPQKMAADFDKLAATTAEEAARQIVRAIEKNQKRLLIGKDAKVLDLMQRALPNHYDTVLGVGYRLLDKFGKR